MPRPLGSSTALVFAAILAFTVLPYFLGLGASSLWDANESFYAETPREMIESGDLLNPSFNYRPRFNKPPLCYWVVGLSYRIFGVSETAERIPIALGALVMIAVALGLGRLLYSTEAGIIAALALASSPRFFMFSRRIIIDVYVAMFMSLALLFFALAEESAGEARLSNRRRLFLMVSYVAVGLGVLTKGPVAALLPAITLVAYLAATRNLSRLREMMIPAGLIILIVIVVPWYAAICREHGWAYLESFLFKDNLSRYTQPVWGPSRGPLFYAPVIMGDFFPWSLVLLPALFYSMLGRLRPSNGNAVADSEADPDKTDHSTSRRRLDLLVLFWIAAIVLFFSLSRSKEDLYILPIYPAAACLVGGLLAGAGPAGGGMRRLTKTALATAAGLVLVGGAAAAYLFGGLNDGYRLAGAGVVGVAAVAGGLFALASVVRSKIRIAVAVLGTSLAVMLWTFGIRMLPDFERFKPVKPLCDRIRELAGPESLVGYYRLASPSMVFYLRRPVFECYEEDELKAMFGSGKEVYCVITAREYDVVKSELPAQSYVLASQPAFQVKLQSILDQDQPPQVLLISNKGGSPGRE